MLKIPFLGGCKMPDVEVTVTLADCSKDIGRPFAILGTDSVLKAKAHRSAGSPTSSRHAS